MYSLNFKTLFKTLLFIMVGLLFSCEMKSVRPSSDESPEAVTGRVDPKYSISKDRAELDELRKNVPEKIRIDNDEKALMAEWFVEEKHSPEKIREKFDQLFRKKRNKLNDDLTKERETFNKEERKKRESFLKELEDDRNDFLKRKVTRESRAEFFSDQDEQRKVFFAEQKEKREEFESNIKEKRKNHEDYFKEKSDEFNAELKSYRLRWNEKQKQNP